MNELVCIENSEVKIEHKSATATRTHKYSICFVMFPSIVNLYCR